jgi:sec-independent protein translocase protein TatC
MPPGKQAEMPFLEHLEELRWRIIWSLAALAIGVALSFFLLFSHEDILLLLQGPVQPYLNGRKLIYTHPADGFRIIMNLALILGTIVASPVILWHVWGFLSPALYKHEKKVVIPVLIFAAVLFLAGVALSWFVILPLTLKVFASIQSASLEPMLSFREYFGFAMSMSLALGAVFELPIAVLALSALELVTPQMLKRFRRYAVVGAIVVSAFITPGQDPFSLLVMTGPLYLLYEVSVAASALVYRFKRRHAARREAEERAQSERDTWAPRSLMEDGSEAAGPTDPRPVGGA